MPEGRGGDRAAGVPEPRELEQRLRAAGLARAAVEAAHERPGLEQLAAAEAALEVEARSPSWPRSAGPPAWPRRARSWRPRGSRGPRGCWGRGTTRRSWPSRRTARDTPAPARTRSAWSPVRMLISCSAERPPKTTVAQLTVELVTVLQAFQGRARPPNPGGLRVVVGQVVLVEHHVAGAGGRHDMRGPPRRGLRTTPGPARLAGAQRRPVGAADDRQRACRSSAVAARARSALRRACSGPSSTIPGVTVHTVPPSPTSDLALASACAAPSGLAL